MAARAKELTRTLIERAGGESVASAALYRKTNTLRAKYKMVPCALQAWCWHVLATATRDAKVPQAGRTAELVEGGTKAGAGIPWHQQNPDRKSRAPTANLSRRGRALAQGRSAAGRADVALRPARQFQVLPAARSGLRQPARRQQRRPRLGRRADAVHLGRSTEGSQRGAGWRIVEGGTPSADVLGNNYRSGAANTDRDAGSAVGAAHAHGNRCSAGMVRTADMIPAIAVRGKWRHSPTVSLTCSLPSAEGSSSQCERSVRTR